MLEAKRLLNARPVALDDLSFYTALNTQLVISQTQDGVSANDFDAEGSSLTATRLANVSNGSLTFNSNGTFTYTPNNGFQGTDWFTYEVSDGTTASRTAKAQIKVGTGLSDRLNYDGAITNELLDNGVVSHVQPLGGGMNLVYRSDTDPAVIIPVHTFLASGTTTPNSINAKLTIGGVDSGTVDYNVTGLTTGTPLRFNLRAFPSSASTGMYDWSMEVNLVYSGSTVTKTFTGQEAIVNRRDSEFGAGWWLDGLDRLYTSSSGALLVNGDGTTQWYPKSGSVWLQAEGDHSYSTLTEASGVYTLTDKWGDTRVFNSNGYLTSVKRLNNSVATYTFSYDGSNRLSEITDEFSRDYTFDYNSTSGKLETATDFFGRESSLTHSSGRLTGITITEETYSGYTAPSWSFAYTNISPQYLLEEVTMPGGSTVDYVYDSTSRRLKEIKNADHTTENPSVWKLYPAIAEGLHVTGSTIAVPKVSDLNPRYVNELNNTFTFKTGRFGDVISFTDALSATTTFEFDPWGQIFRLTAADPDGAGSQTSPVTKYGYSSWGDLVITVHPDGNNIRASYHSTLHLPTTVWNELDETQVMEYYSNGNLETWTDESGNTWEYTWDSHGSLLTETSPDPDGAGSLSAIVTTREYDSTYYYRLTEFTHGDSNYRTWTWNSHDEIATATNELGKTTSWTYDPLGRVRTQTLPDPDGAGSQTSPVYSWTYGSNLLLATATDPLGNVTSWTYDNRHRLIELTLPDPDGGGSLTSPEYTWTYNKISLVTAETRPEFNGTSIAYTWNANGWMTNSAGPVSGQDTDMAYDALGRLTETTAASGRVIKRTYDSRSRLASVIDHDPDGAGPLVGATETYAYNAASQLTSVTDALGRVTSFAWSDTGWLTSKTMPDPDGSGSASAPVYTWTHDTLGRITKSTDGAARETSYTWNSRNLVTRVTEPDPDGTGPGNNLTATYTDYAYDAGARLTSVTRWGSRVTSYSYDHLDRLLSTTLPDPDGAGSKSSPVYSQTYDAANNVLTKTDALNNTTTYTYDNLHRLKTITEQDPDGAGGLSSPVWTYAYNNYNQLSSITNPMSHVASFGYDTAGRRTTETDALGNVTTTAYDVMDRVTSVTTPDPDGAGSLTAAVTSYTYDIYSRVSQVTDANSGTINYGYDLIGRLLRLEDQSGNETFWTYDDLDRTTMETDELGKTRSFYYNEMDRLVRKTDRLGRTTQYGYHGYTETEVWYQISGSAPEATITTTTQGTSGTDEVQTITLANTSDGTFILGFDGQTTAPIAWNASAATVETALEALQNIDNVTVSKSGSTWTVTFVGAQAGNNVSQLQGAVKPASDGTTLRTITYSFNEVGDLVTADDSTNVAEYNYTVDKLGRTTRTDELIGGMGTVFKVYQDFDAVGNRTILSVDVPDEWNDITLYKNTYTFDGLNRLDNVQQFDVAGGHVVADKRVNYVYNALSQVTYINRFHNLTGGDGAALRTYFTYDSADRVATMQHRNVDNSTTSNLLNQYTFAYDNVSRITQIDSSIDGVSNFTLDKLNQVTAADHASGRTDESYSFDSTGNRTGGDYVVTSKNRTTDSTGYDYEYDAEGNRTKRTKTSDSSYEMYTWDHRNRLTKVEFYNSSHSLTKSIDYFYDMFGRMVRRTLDSNGSGSGGVSDTWWAAFDRIHATLEFDGNQVTDLTHRYLWGQFQDDLLADEIVTSTSSAGTIQWALSDQVNTIRDIGKWDSGASDFVIANHRVYNTFGKLESETDGSIDLAFGFNGKWTEGETGYTHHLNRWYDAVIGKWLSEDPIGFSAGDPNLVRFVGNKALSYFDSDGLEEVLSTEGTGSGTAPTREGLLNQHETRQDKDRDVSLKPKVFDPSTSPPSPDVLSDGKGPGREVPRIIRRKNIGHNPELLGYVVVYITDYDHDDPDITTTTEMSQYWNARKAEGEVDEVYDNIDGFRSLIDALKGEKDKSIDELYGDGHGSRTGNATKDPKDNLSFESLDRLRVSAKKEDQDLYNDFIRTMKSKFKPGALWFVGGCEACKQGVDRRIFQKYADELGISIIVSTGTVSTIGKKPDWIGTNGTWLVFSPSN